MKAFSILILLLFLVLTQARYLRYSWAFAMSNTSTFGNDTILMNTFLRGRYGLEYVAFSNSNTSLIGGLVLMAYTNSSTGTQSLFRYVGGNDTDLKPVLHPNDDGLVIRCIDTNEYPIGKYVDGFFMQCLFNQTLFEKTFGTTFFATAGFSYLWKDRPLGPTNFPWPLPPTIPYSWEKQTIEYSLESSADLGLREHFPRWEVFHLSIWIISLCFYVVVAILVLLFSGQQPLKSRGIMPFLATCAQFFHLALEFPPLFLSVNDLQYQCLYLFVFQRPTVIIIVQLSIQHFFSYVVMINMNQKKAKFLRNRKEGGDIADVPPLIKFVKIIKHPIFTIAFIVGSLILFAAIFLIPWSVDAYCTPYAEQINRYLYGVTLGVMFFGSLVLILLFDFWINFGRFKRCELMKFWKEDIFYLRFEIYVFGIGLTFTYFIIYTILSQFRFSTLATGVITSLSFHFLFFFQVGFALIITMVQTAIRCICREKKDQVIDRILDSSKGRDLFREHLEMEFAIENLTSWEDMMRFKAEGDAIKRQALAVYIYKLYFNGKSSQLEVNVPQSVCKAIKEGLSDTQRNLFDDGIKHMVMNLQDSFMRLRTTPEFISLNAKERFLDDPKKKVIPVTVTPVDQPLTDVRI